MVKNWLGDATGVRTIRDRRNCDKGIAGVEDWYLDGARLYCPRRNLEAMPLSVN